MIIKFEALKFSKKGCLRGKTGMKRDEVIAKARSYLLRTSLLSDIIAAEDGPVIDHAEGSVVWDTEGKSYLDFNSGQMCSTLGHNHARITQAIREQSAILTHASTVYYNVPQVELAARIASINDLPLRKSVLGDEIVENDLPKRALQVALLASTVTQLSTSPPKLKAPALCYV